MNIILFLFVFYFASSEPLKFAFKTRFNKANMNKDNVMQMLINNDIIINMTFGSNNQNIEMNIKTQKDSTFILSESCAENIYAKKFNENTSNTYEKLFDKKTYYMYEFKDATHSKDVLTLDQNKKLKINDFRFMLANVLWDGYQKYMGGMIGLILSNKEDIPRDTDFITQLKNNEIIKSYVFMLDYKDNYNGIFYVGNYLHEYDNDYKSRDCLMMKAGKDNQKVRLWEINIDKIINENENIIVQNNTSLQLYYEFGILAAPEKYHNYIVDNFFKKYIDNHICANILDNDEIAIFHKYNYIVCNKTEFDIKSFPDLNFYNSEINYTFSFNYKDLFYEFENKVYFLVVFPVFQMPIEYWYVGKPFFVKYKLFFDKDKKTIGLYEEIEQKQKEKQIIIKESNMYIIYIIIILLLAILLIVVLYYFIIVKKSRKIRANELDEEAEYIAYGDDNKNKNIN
jgi:hypothetical protein